ARTTLRPAAPRPPATTAPPRAPGALRRRCGAPRRGGDRRRRSRQRARSSPMIGPVPWPGRPGYYSGMPTTPDFRDLTVPTDGDAITLAGGHLQVPDTPIIPFIEGDGTGPDIWRASQYVLDSAVTRAYGGKRRLAWFEVFAGEKSKDRFDSWLPDDTLK